MCEVDSRPVHGQKGAEWVQTLIQRRIERGGIVRRGGRSDESRGRQPKWPASHHAWPQAGKAHAVRIGCDMRKATGAFDMSVINMFLLTFILALIFGFCFPSIPRDLHRKAARRCPPHRTVVRYFTRSARRDTARRTRHSCQKSASQRNVATTTQLSRLERYHRFEVDDVRC